jgi:hypothetical protein
MGSDATGIAPVVSLIRETSFTPPVKPRNLVACDRRGHEELRVERRG